MRVRVPPSPPNKVNRKNKYKDSFDRGSKSEDNWVALMQSRGNKVKKATFEQDTKLHIDFWITNKLGNTYSVDIKSPKKYTRLGAVLSDEVWVEYKNVIGKNGWLLGKADFIAFELSQVFLMVKRVDLKNLCDKLININIKAVSSEKALYKRWTRPENPKEISARIKIHDIKDNIEYIEYKKIMGE